MFVCGICLNEHNAEIQSLYRFQFLKQMSKLEQSGKSEFCDWKKTTNIEVVS